MIQAKVIVLHVKQGYEERERHIRRVLGEKNIDFEFLLDGDMADLTPDMLDKYFVGDMKRVSPEASCAMKHLLAYEHIVEHGLPGALILEDDMILYKNFIKVFNNCMDELSHRHITDAFISFEDSNLRFVPFSQRHKGQYLYPASRDRFTGCYYITNLTARNILNYVRTDKCDRHIDLFHRSLITRIGLPYYWCQPCIATQGTHNGLFQSSINDQFATKQQYRARTWQFKLAYKKLLYLFR